MSDSTVSPIVSIPLETITQRILVLRSQKVLLDSDLAALYDVPTKRFNEQVKRNLERFPADFMFQLTDEEYAALRVSVQRSHLVHAINFPYAAYFDIKGEHT